MILFQNIFLWNFSLFHLEEYNAAHSMDQSALTKNSYYGMKLIWHIFKTLKWTVKFQARSFKLAIKETIGRWAWDGSINDPTLSLEINYPD